MKLNSSQQNVSRMICATSELGLLKPSKPVLPHSFSLQITERVTLGMRFEVIVEVGRASITQGSWKATWKGATQPPSLPNQDYYFSRK
jgi:hypothetical protein